MSNNSHWKLTRGWQKDSYTTLARKGSQGNQVRKEGRWTSLDLVPWEEEKEDYTGRDSPGEYVVQAHIGCPIPGTHYQGRWIPLSDWKALWDKKRALGSLGSACEEGATCLWGFCLGREGGLKLHGVLVFLTTNQPSIPQPERSDHSDPTCFRIQLHPGTKSAMVKGRTQLEEQRWLRPRDVSVLPAAR